MPLLESMDAVLWSSPKVDLVNSKSYEQGFRKLYLRNVEGREDPGEAGETTDHTYYWGRLDGTYFLLVTGGLLSRSCVCMRKLMSV